MGDGAVARLGRLEFVRLVVRCLLPLGQGRLGCLDLALHTQGRGLEVRHLMWGESDSVVVVRMRVLAMVRVAG